MNYATFHSGLTPDTLARVQSAVNEADPRSDFATWRELMLLTSSTNDGEFTMEECAQREKRAQHLLSVFKKV